jgi:hypothetical protein
MSPRTAKYVAAMVREGDDFHYNQWLKRVREEEAEAKPAKAMGTLGELVPAQVPVKTFDAQHPQPNPPPPLTVRTKLARALRPHRRAKSTTPKAQLRRWLERVRYAWDEFQGSRKRDGVYKFLTAIFDLVMHYKVRRRTTRLLRHAFNFADRPFVKNADPFSAVIRCTCGNTVDNKLVSKWSRVLRYTSRCKKPDMRLKRFMKKMGGVNACASLHAKQRGRNNRVAAI